MNNLGAGVTSLLQKITTVQITTESRKKIKGLTLASPGHPNQVGTWHQLN